MHAANNKDYWKEAMEAILGQKAQRWKSDAETTRKYLHHVGRLWKTLEVALNHAHLDMDLCLFICSQVMNAVWWRYSGGMSFVPILTRVPSNNASGAQNFGLAGKVRYRAQGTVPQQRYPHRAPRADSGPTRGQLQGVFLLRPFVAAPGTLPGASASKLPRGR